MGKYTKPKKKPIKIKSSKGKTISKKKTSSKKKPVKIYYLKKDKYGYRLVTNRFILTTDEPFVPPKTLPEWRWG